MPCVVRSSNLVQELGMVSNVFSDKTGTLTRNEMRFVKFIIDGKLFDMDSPIGVSNEKISGGDKQSSDKKKVDSPISTAQSDVTALLAAPGGKETKVSCEETFPSFYHRVRYILQLNYISDDYFFRNNL